MTANDYIEAFTRRCSNELAWKDEQGQTMYQEWLTPRHAATAVAIAREQLIDKAVEWLAENAELYKTDNGIAYGNLIMDFREAMEE